MEYDNEYDENRSQSDRSTVEDLDLISDEEQDNNYISRKRASDHFRHFGDEPLAKQERKTITARLVSYDDDDDDAANVSLERDEGINGTVIDKCHDSPPDDIIVTERIPETKPQEILDKEVVISHPYMGHDTQLPPEPPGKCPRRMQDKVAELIAKMVGEGKNMNQSIQATKKFRNPSIYEKLLEYLDIDEKGTNYPPELYNPGIWGPDSHYEQLAKAQRVDMEKKEKDKKEGKRDKSTNQLTKKPKTKWDDPSASSNIQSDGSHKLVKS